VTLPPISSAPTNAPSRSTTVSPTLNPAGGGLLLESELEAWSSIFESLDGESWSQCSTVTDPCGDPTCSPVRASGRFVVCEPIENDNRRLRRRLQVDDPPRLVITRIVLPNNNIAGTLKREQIEAFLALRTLNLQGNDVTGNGPINACIDAQFCYADNASCDVPNLCGEEFAVGADNDPAWVPPANPGETVSYADRLLSPGESVLFIYGLDSNVARLSSEDAFENCDFAGSSVIATPEEGDGDGFRFVVTNADIGRRIYLTNTIPDGDTAACRGGQKVNFSVRGDIIPTLRPSSAPANRDNMDNEILAIVLALLLLLCVLPCLCFCCIFCLRKHHPEYLPEKFRKDLDLHLVIMNDKREGFIHDEDTGGGKTKLMTDFPTASRAHDVVLTSPKARPLSKWECEEKEMMEILSQNPGLRQAKLEAIMLDRKVSHRIVTIEDLLRETDLLHYLPVFEQENMDLEATVYASQGHLRALGLTIGETVKLNRVSKMVRHGLQKPNVGGQNCTLKSALKKSSVSDSHNNKNDGKD